MAGETEHDPIVIHDYLTLCTVMNDPAAGGYYALAGDILVGTSTARVLARIIGNTGRGDGTYAPRVITGNGHMMHVKVSQSADFGALFRNIFFKNIVLKIEKGAFGNSNYDTYFFDWCSLSDCTVLIDRSIINVYTGFMTGIGIRAGLKPRTFQRTLWADLDGGSVNWAAAKNSWTDIDTYPHNYIVGVGISPWVRQASSIALSAVDALSNGEFSASGWGAKFSHLYASPPSGEDEITATISTYTADGVGCPRLLWCESGGRLSVIGTTPGDGLAQVAFRVRKGLAYTILASEEIGAELAYVGMAVTSERRYLASYDADHAFIAKTDGTLTDIIGFGWSEELVTVGGIQFRPIKRYPPAQSVRQSSLTTGLLPRIDVRVAAGGSGPVVSGDPAYLEGAVEEIHPMTGARQALTNCEVVAFERRGSDYVAMGNTYTDGIGGFRLETEVYGGGDVFAFAADFPGVIFQPGVPLNVGDRIRPALANGYVYEIIQPGTAGAAEPVWWPDQGNGTEGDIGTARARARPYYQPVGHGPLKMTLIE